MKTLITGATGFIGSRLALRCLEQGESVRATGRLRGDAERDTARLLSERGAELVEASVTERDRLPELVRDVAVVYHLAAAQHEANVPDRHFHEVNVEGTRSLLEASAAAGVERFVHGSTIGVYGGAGQPIDESSPLEPANIYGVTKLAGEEVVRAHSAPPAWAIVRIAETYGPGDRRLLKLFRGVASGLFLRVGSCRNLHHLVYIDDLVEALRRAARDPRAVGETFVAAGGRAVTTREMIDAAAAALGARGPRLWVPLFPLLATAALLEAALRPLGIQPPLHRRRMDFFRRSFAFEGRRARAVLDWEPQIGLEEGMAATARWYREQGLV